MTTTPLPVRVAAAHLQQGVQRALSPLPAPVRRALATTARRLRPTMPRVPWPQTPRGRRLASILLALVVVLIGGAGIGGAYAPADAAPWDCKSAPDPASPREGLRGMIAPEPDRVVTGDPFTDPTVSISSVYGYSYTWQVYDTGCADGLIGWVAAQNDIANWGMGIGASIRALTDRAYSEIIDPGWTLVFDPILETVALKLNTSIRLPWIPLVVTLVAVTILWRAREGAYPAVVSAAAWALVMLGVGAAAVNYPITAAATVDGLVSNAVGSVAKGFTTVTGTSATTPAEMAAHQLDTLNRNTLYANWAKGYFGSADSATAKKYGPALFKASHLTWAESAIVESDPSGQGKQIIDDHHDEWDNVTEQIKDADPRAYAHLTGKQGRWAAAGTIIVSGICIDPFLLVSMIFVLLAYLVIRLVVPILPATTTLALHDATQDKVRDFSGQVFSLLIRGPLFFLAAMVNMTFSVAILNSDISLAMRYLLAGAISYILWKLLNPLAAFGTLPGAGARRRLGSAANAYITGRAIGATHMESLPRRNRNRGPNDWLWDDDDTQPHSTRRNRQVSRAENWSRPALTGSSTGTSTASPAVYTPGRPAAYDDGRADNAHTVRVERAEPYTGARRRPETVTTIIPSARSLPPGATTHNDDDADLGASTRHGGDTPNISPGSGGVKFKPTNTFNPGRAGSEAETEYHARHPWADEPPPVTAVEQHGQSAHNRIIDENGNEVLMVWRDGGLQILNPEDPDAA